jgi:hypothetical protein
VAGQEQFLADLGERQVGGEHRQQAELGAGQRRGPGGALPPDVATALGYDVAAALEEPGDR